MLARRLKEETEDCHARAEAAVGLMDGPVTRVSYTRYLRRLAELYGPLEEALASHAAAWARLGVDLEARRKLPLLLEDLRELGEDGALERGVALPSAATFARAAGIQYVLEGQTLGGKYVRRHLRAQAQEELSTRFLESYGEDVGARWREFVAALEQLPPADGDEVVAGARDAFDMLTRWLAQR